MLPAREGERSAGRTRDVRAAHNPSHPRTGDVKVQVCPSRAPGRSVVVGLLLHEERIHPALHAPQLSWQDRSTGQRIKWFTQRTRLDSQQQTRVAACESISCRCWW